MLRYSFVLFLVVAGCGGSQTAGAPTPEETDGPEPSGGRDASIGPVPRAEAGADQKLATEAAPSDSPVPADSGAPADATIPDGGEDPSDAAPPDAAEPDATPESDAAPPPPVSGPLTDAERQKIVDSVVPNAMFKPSLDLCKSNPRRDDRGKFYQTNSTGTVIPTPSCILGAKVRGTFSRSLGWSVIKQSHDGDGIRWSGGTGLVHVIGVYIDNIEDPIGPPKSPDTSRQLTWLVEHMYVNYSRDDVVENDACLDGKLHDSLIDGTHVLISARPGAGNSVNYKATHTITNTLARLDCKPDPRSDSAVSSCPPGQSVSHLFKWSPCAGTVKMSDSILRVDARSRNGTGPMAFPPGEYKNVWLIYLGPEERYPGTVPASGVTEVRDTKLWDMARSKWLQRHGCDEKADHCTMLDK